MVKNIINVVIKKEFLAENIVKLVIYNPQIAKKAKAGQFVIIRVDPKGERIPLTISDSDEKAG
ncbi:MAG: sulfide/dihydroorotate dehydrogenase-like FAD/NAD-binding protein, partial [Actinomycetota bacterium]|nr:sulfide/dihydroorotate dehydrogenase-like FAD/NAD-binding protein [Actinomycetota bacterium]